MQCYDAIMDWRSGLRKVRDPTVIETLEGDRDIKDTALKQLVASLLQSRKDLLSNRAVRHRQQEKAKAKEQEAAVAAAAKKQAELDSPYRCSMSLPATAC